MSWRQEWECRSVNDSQVADSKDFGMVIHYSVGICIVTHGASTCGVEDGTKTLLDQLKNICVARDTCSWPVLRANSNIGHGGTGPRLACSLICCDGHSLIGRMGQPVGVDQWLIVRVRGRDGDVAARQRLDKTHGDGCVVVPVGRSILDEVVLVALETGNGQVLKIRPV
jgi:hypothetical protein